MTKTIDLIEAAAQAAHEAIRAIQVASGEEPAAHWEDAEPWQRDSSRASVVAAAAGQTGREQHETWFAKKKADGWVHGDVKDSVAMTHPDMVDYDDLSEIAKRKDLALVAIANAFLGPVTG